MNTKTHIPNKIIILGGNHHNELGIIRSLGEVGCEIYFITLGENNKSFVSKSKYIKNNWFALGEEDLLKILQEKFSEDKLRPIIFPSNDDTVAFIDKNINLLNEKFILPSINNQKNSIIKHMNKMEMTNLAKKHGFLVPSGFVVDLSDLDNVQTYMNEKGIEYPCIIKPMQSLGGLKSDIVISNNINELILNLRRIKDRYKNVFIQEFIRKQEEISIQGLAINSGEIIIPSVIKRIRESSIAPSTTYAKVIKPDIPEVIKKLKDIIKDLGYKGIFDIDLIISQGRYFFIEINFRNGAYGYAVTKAGVNMPELWSLNVIGKDISKISTIINKKTTFMSEFADFNNISFNKVGIIKWMTQFFTADTHLIFNKKDLKPFFFKFIYR